jgi:hypothetical protein
MNLDADARIERAPQQRSQRLQHRRHVDRARLQDLAPREREQLGGEFGAAARGARRGGDQVLRQLIAAHGGQVFEHLQVALNHRQQVVEVVRNAARELAHRFDALRMVQRFFAVQALQRGGEQAGHRFERGLLISAEMLRLA